MMVATKLSIIMPCCNVASTIGTALDSILMQRVDFRYEVIIVNDASTDSTRAIIRDYAEKDNRIIILDNETNLGNAGTFKKGAEASAGEYLCVLDGDDFYTVRDKLQRQVDFLDGDKEGRYAAVAHKYLMFYPDGRIREDMRLFGSVPDEHTYFEFITQHFYWHTSTMMYRNIFRGLEIPILSTQRGDTIRTLIAMNSTCGRIKILNFVGSAYRINPDGIWSSLDAERRKKVNVETWAACERHVESRLEKRIIADVVNRMENQEPAPDGEEGWAIGVLLSWLASSWASVIAFKERDFIFRKLYKSDFLDSFCESLGFVSRHVLGIGRSERQDIKKAAIVISALNKTGGGIYQEILELVTLLQGKKVSIILTDMAGLDEFTHVMRADFANFRNLSFIFLKGSPNLLESLQKVLADGKPARIYWYCGHNNTWADAALQAYGGKNIVPFSFDHGLSLGLSNSNIDLIIAKTPKDYKLLSSKFGSRVIYVPCWSAPAKTARKYSPLEGRETLNTATAAARFYKYEGDVLGSFRYFILSLLKATRGRHVHYGPLPDGLKAGIVRALNRCGIEKERFVHIEWANNLPDAMLKAGTDIFISPFPVSSIKLSLQCLSAGIPVMAYAGGLTRIEQNDFLNHDVLRWKTREDFFAVLDSLDRDKLVSLSESGLEHFRTHNDLSAVMPYIVLEKCFDPVPIPPKFIDDRIIDANEILDLINMSSCV